jgi:glycosyltransferase involved in cell wall biosynthesis
MDISHLNYGIIHSLIGKNDGVSIVIDQSVTAMVKNLNIGLGNIYFLAAHTSPRFNAQTNEVFWHKNEIHKTIINRFNDPADESDPNARALDVMIHDNAIIARDIISDFVQKNSIDIIIAHNTSHLYNFITAVGLGYYFEDLRSRNLVWPKLLVWWHDSYFEREQFSNPGPVIRKYLKYLPGTYVDGIVFINSIQPELARKMFVKYGHKQPEAYFRERTVIIPNTHDIIWDWRKFDWNSPAFLYPPQDNYNNSFFHDIGLTGIIEKAGYTMSDTLILLQHTRIVPRKKIEFAIDLAFSVESRLREAGINRCIVLLISGHSGDEQARYKEFLTSYFHMKQAEFKGFPVFMIYGEEIILSHRDIIVDKKYYNFAEVPSIVASAGGIGTYFSEVEGFGNNLLEMLAAGLPVIINYYSVYKTDLEPLGFNLPYIEDNVMTNELIDTACKIATDLNYRNKIVVHNLEVLDQKLGSRVISDSLGFLINNIFTKGLPQ